MKNINDLENQLGHKFKDRSILFQALTHPSFGHECLQDKPVALRDNERLEFLGDSILSMIISNLLFEKFPTANEGLLSKMRASVVNANTLAALAKSLDLGSYINLGKGEILSEGSQKPSILSNTLEAIIAAIFIDGGLNAISQTIHKIFNPILQSKATVTPFSDHKSQLQELIQAKHKIAPTYHLISKIGTHHNQTFNIEIRVKDQIIASASGSSKKSAEQNAAKLAVQALCSQQQDEKVA